MKAILLIIFLQLGALSQASAQAEINPKVKGDKDKQFIINEIDKNATTYNRVSRDIWGYAELGFNETRSTSALQELLKANGFKVEAGVSGDR